MYYSQRPPTYLLNRQACMTWLFLDQLSAPSCSICLSRQSPHQLNRPCRCLTQLSSCTAVRTGAMWYNQPLNQIWEICTLHIVSAFQGRWMHMKAMQPFQASQRKGSVQRLSAHQDRCRCMRTGQCCHISLTVTPCTDTSVITHLFMQSFEQQVFADSASVVYPQAVKAASNFARC